MEVQDTYLQGNVRASAVSVRSLDRDRAWTIFFPFPFLFFFFLLKDVHCATLPRRDRKF